MPPGTPAELGPPALAPWGTYLFPLKCPSTFRINETPVVNSSSLHDFYLKEMTGIGPIRSVTKSYHGPEGSSVLCIGSGGYYCPVTSQPWQRLHICSTSLSILGHHTFVRRLFFVFSIPWCRSWPNSNTTFRKLWGITILSPRNTNLPKVHSPLLKRIYPSTEHWD